MTRFRILAFTFVLVGALAAPARAESPTATPPLRVGTSGDYRPFSFRDAAGAPTGFEVAVAQRLAVDLGRPLELVPFRWPELITQLQNGAFDVAMSGVTSGPERALRLALSRPYAVTGAVAVIRDADRQRFRRLADLDRPQVRIAVNGGGYLERVTRQHFPHAVIVAVSDNTTLPDRLERRDAGAVISEQFEARTWNGKHFTTLGPFTHDRKVYAFPRDAAELRRRLDDWLVAHEADGWLNAQRRRWLGAAAVTTPQESTIEALVGAMQLRLQLMPLVAAVKQREQLPIHDAAQETRVLAKVHDAAATAGLDPESVAALFRVQMDAAKDVEEHPADAADVAGVSLDDVRAAVGAASDQIIAELARGRLWLRDPSFRTHLGAAMRDGLSAPGLTPQRVQELVAATLRVSAAA